MSQIFVIDIFKSKIEDNFLDIGKFIGKKIRKCSLKSSLECSKSKKQPLTLLQEEKKCCS